MTFDQLLTPAPGLNTSDPNTKHLLSLANARCTPYTAEHLKNLGADVRYGGYACMLAMVVIYAERVHAATSSIGNFLPANACICLNMGHLSETAAAAASSGVMLMKDMCERVPISSNLAHAACRQMLLMPVESEVAAFTGSADKGARQAAAALVIQEAYRMYRHRQLVKVSMAVVILLHLMLFAASHLV